MKEEADCKNALFQFNGLGQFKRAIGLLPLTNTFAKFFITWFTCSFKIRKLIRHPDVCCLSIGNYQEAKSARPQACLAPVAINLPTQYQISAPRF